MARTLTEALDFVKNEFVQNAKQQAKRYHERIKLVESNYLAAQLLASVGIEANLGVWCPESLTLELKSGKQLIKVREALGCKLKATGNKSVVEKSRNKVWVEVEAADFPGLTVKYKAKPPAQAKCKVVKRRRTSYYRTLVCEA